MSNYWLNLIIESLDLDNYGLYLVLLVASPIFIFSGYCFYILFILSSV